MIITSEMKNILIIWRIDICENAQIANIKFSLWQGLLRLGLSVVRFNLKRIEMIYVRRTFVPTIGINTEQYSRSKVF